jgi:hypothetical protein
MQQQKFKLTLPHTYTKGLAKTGNLHSTLAGWPPIRQHILRPTNFFENL